MKNVTTGVTSKDKGYTVTQKITRTKRLDVMLAYAGKHGADEMLKAAKFKSERLIKAHKNNKVLIYRFTTVDSLQKIWSEIFDITSKVTKSGALVYELYEMHFFGHSRWDRLYLDGEGQEITIPMVKDFKALNWNKDNGIFVIHACRSGRLESSMPGDNGEINYSCIAGEFSKCQNNKTIGQMMYATFNTGDTFDDLKYRNGGLSNKISVDLFGFNNLVLWGYKSEGLVQEQYSKDSEYQTLDDWQIWPARLFVNGSANSRNCKAGEFNKIDEEYI